MSPRIKPSMNSYERINVVVDGYPAAVSVCSKIIKNYYRVDPRNTFGFTTYICTLDRLGIRGEKLYTLWNDICGRHISKLIALIKAYQMGQVAGVTQNLLDVAISQKSSNINFGAIFKRLTDEMPEFNCRVRG